MYEDSVLSSLAVRRQAEDGPHAVAERLRGGLFGSMRRSDQRRRAEQYLNGLLEVEGRKSVRNIAAHIDGGASEQGLHHFIGSSTWDWRPVYAALTRGLLGHRPPQAWVVRSLPIPKAGTHSVGVDRQLAGDHAQVFNGQLAFGTWYATEEMSAPVNWRLHLPEAWLGDEARRLRAEIPDSAVAQTPDQCAVSAALEGAARGAGAERRPVVLDTRLARPAALIRALTEARVPLIARIDRSAALAVADSSLPGCGGGVRPAQRIVESVKGLRRPVTWCDSAADRMYAGHVVGVRVRAAAQPGAASEIPGGQGLLLLGEWHHPQRPPAELWLTNMAGAPLGSLLRLTKLSRRVAHDVETFGGPAGLRDFEGRSYKGWHRHMALASAACAVTALGSLPRDAEELSSAVSAVGYRGRTPARTRARTPVSA